MDLISILLALAAGVLSILSPCVLPLVPIVLGTAVAEHRLGPVALAAGLAVSFTAIGLFVATIGYSVGLDSEVFRRVGAVLLIAIGAVLVMPRWQARVALAAGPLSAWTQQKFDHASHGGLARQFGVGAMLGAVWSPCVGPTLGTASALAAQGRDLGQAALMMLMFGLGSALPLLLLGMNRQGSVGIGEPYLLGSIAAVVPSTLKTVIALPRKLETSRWRPSKLHE